MTETSPADRLKIILTGATGMVGEGVLLECLDNAAVAQVLLVTRKPYPLEHAKLQQCIVPDFMNLDACVPQFDGYDACFFCAGVSSAGMKEADYTRVTYDLTLHIARTLAAINPRMTFIYVSGAHTDSTEKGRIMWARVKGRTENELTRVGFAHVYIFRPGFMKPMPGQRNIKGYYNAIGWLYPILRAISANLASTLRDVALAMIHVTRHGYPRTILEVKDINALAAS